MLLECRGGKEAIFTSVHCTSYKHPSTHPTNKHLLAPTMCHALVCAGTVQIKKAWPCRNPQASAVSCPPKLSVTMQRPVRKSDFWKDPVTVKGWQPEVVPRKSLLFPPPLKSGEDPANQ